MKRLAKGIRMVGENELVLNHEALRFAVQRYLNEDVFQYAQKVKVTGLKRTDRNGRFMYTVTLEGLDAFIQKQKATEPARPSQGQGEPVAAAEHDTPQESGASR